MRVFFSLSLTSWFYSCERWTRREETIEEIEAETRRLKEETARLRKREEWQDRYIEAGARVERVEYDDVYLRFPDGRGGYLTDRIKEDESSEPKGESAASPSEALPEPSPAASPSEVLPEPSPVPSPSEDPPEPLPANKQNPQYQ